MSPRFALGGDHILRRVGVVGSGGTLILQRVIMLESYIRLAFCDHKRWLGAAFAIVVLNLGGFTGRAFAEAPSHSPFPLTILGKLYSDGRPLDRGLIPISIRRMAAWDHYLYVALIDRDLDHLLDVWDVRDPSAPELIDSLNFGNIVENSATFTPVALSAMRGTLILEAKGSLFLYRHQPNGKLELLKEQRLVTNWGVPGMGALSFAGPYASHLQQVIRDEDVGTVPNDDIHDEVFLNFSDPAAPFLIRGRTPLPKLNHLAAPTPLNALHRGGPARLTFDSLGGTAALVSYRPRTGAHIERFWSAKLNSVFRKSALESPLDTLLDEAIGKLDLGTLKTNLLDLYEQHVNVSASDLGSLIGTRHPEDKPLAEILALYGISPSDPLSAALGKIFAQACDAQLEAALAGLIYTPAVQSWLDTTLALSGPATGAQFESALAAAFDEELDSDGIPAYLTQRIVGPLLGNPAFMRWSLQDLLDNLTASPAASVLDATLTVTGAGAIDEVLDFVDRFVDLPNCARFPRSTRELLKTALLADGAKLDPDGLAWFEWLKFYRYVVGDGDYSGLIAQLDERFRALHRALGADLFRKFSGVSMVPGAANWDTPQWLREYAAIAPAREVVAEALSEALLSSLSLHGVQGDIPVHEALTRWNLHLNEPGLPRARVGDLVAALNSRGLDTLRLTNLFQQARIDTADLELHLDHFLRRRLQMTFGVALTDWSLQEALIPFISSQLNLSAIGNSVRDHLGRMLQDAVRDSDKDPASYLGYLTSATRAFDGDCIAQWLAALEAARIATFVLDGGSTALAASEALSMAYHAAADYCVQLLIVPLANEIVGAMSGDFSSWTSQLDPTSYGPFTVFLNAEDQTHIIRHAWVWQDQVGFAVQVYSEGDLNNLKRVFLLLLKPSDPKGSVTQLELGRWTNLDYVHMADGGLYLGGDYFLNDSEPIPSGQVMILDLTKTPVTVQRMTGFMAADASVATHFIRVNQGAHFALAANDGVLFLPNHIGRQSMPRPNPAVEFIRVEPNSDGSVRLTLTGRRGGTVRLDVSPNLEDWRPVATLPNLSGEVQFTDRAASGLSHRFYRATAQ